MNIRLQPKDIRCFIMEIRFNDLLDTQYDLIGVIRVRLQNHAIKRIIPVQISALKKAGLNRPALKISNLLFIQTFAADFTLGTNTFSIKINLTLVSASVIILSKTVFVTAAFSIFVGFTDNGCYRSA